MAKGSNLVEKVILFSVFFIFAIIIVFFSGLLDYFKADDALSVNLGEYQYTTVSKVKPEIEENNEKTALININTADAKMLETLPGIGPTKAAAIIEYREKQGVFGSIEQIKEVKGIGDKTFENIKDLITTK